MQKYNVTYLVQGQLSKTITAKNLDEAYEKARTAINPLEDIVPNDMEITIGEIYDPAKDKNIIY